MNTGTRHAPESQRPGQMTLVMRAARIAGPHRPSRPRLPLGVKQAIGGEIDWRLTVIAAFSFLVHFGVIGSLYSDWTDPIVSEGVTTGGLVDMLAKIPAVPVEPPVQGETVLAPVAESTLAPGTPAPTPVKKTPGTSVTDPGRASEAREAALARQAEKMLIDTVGAYGGDSALDGVLRRGEIPPVDLSAIAPSSSGVSASTVSGLSFGTAGDRLVHPGGASRGLAGIGPTRGTADDGAGRGRTEPGPTVDAEPGKTIETVPIANADRIVAGLRPAFRQCYSRGLGADPGMSGKVVIAAKVAANGEVSAADAVSSSGLSAGVIACIQRKIMNAQFDPPGPTGSTVRIPITFVQQGR